MKRSAINKVSKKRKLDNALYAKAKKEYMELHNACEICRRFTPIHLHHKKGRMGDLLFNKEFFMALCGQCHKRVHDLPDLSRKLGYLLDRLSL